MVGWVLSLSGRGCWNFTAWGLTNVTRVAFSFFVVADLAHFQFNTRFSLGRGLEGVRRQGLICGTFVLL